jgi:hypothetical protein
MEHCLKIVDFYIMEGCPEKFIVEPVLGEYIPDVMFKDKGGKSLCVEVQLTPISLKKMQRKVDSFAREFGKSHDARILVIASERPYKGLVVSQGFKLVQIRVPQEIQY